MLLYTVICCFELVIVVLCVIKFKRYLSYTTLWKCTNIEMRIAAKHMA